MVKKKKSEVSIEGNLDESMLSACQEGDAREIGRMLKLGADPRAVDSDGRTAPMLCMEALVDSWWTWMEAQGPLEALASAGADLNARDNIEENAAMYAARLDEPSALAWLAKNGARVLEADSDGDTPLHEAARYGTLACVELLLGLGADSRAVCKNDGVEQTPARAAWEYSDLYGEEAARLLEAHAANQERAELDKVAGPARSRSRRSGI